MEVGELVLFVDDEEADATIMSSMAKRCLDRLKWLIVERGLLQVGYTKFAIQLLERRRIFPISKSTTRTIHTQRRSTITDRGVTISPLKHRPRSPIESSS